MERVVVKNFSHSGNSGDLIASLPVLRQHYRSSGVKPNLYLIKDHPAIYYEGAIHPVKNEAGEHVSLNQHMIDMLLPLLRAQPYLDEVKVWEEEKVQINLCEIRNTFVGMPNFSINRWYFYVFPDLACDLSENWLEIPDTGKDFAKNKIIIGRTERYLNDSIDYSFLKEYEDDLLFTGTTREWNTFCSTFDLNIKMLNVANFLELAQAIKQAWFHISNQTMAFQISEAIHHPRILELSRIAPNVIPIGKYAYDFFWQGALEYYVSYLYNLKSPDKLDFNKHVEEIAMR